jgi:hypothetical protein
LTIPADLFVCEKDKIGKILLQRKKRTKDSIKTIGSLTLNFAALASCTSPLELCLQLEPIPGIQINLLVAPQNILGLDSDDLSTDGSLLTETKDPQQDSAGNEPSDEETRTPPQHFEDFIETLRIRDLEISSLVRFPSHTLASPPPPSPIPPLLTDDHRGNSKILKNKIFSC